MAAMVGKYAANKLLKKQMSKYVNKSVDGGEVSFLPCSPKHTSNTDTTRRTLSSPWSRTPNDPAK